MQEFSIDPDIRKAETLPAWVYASDEAYQAQRSSVFARTWQFAGDANRVKASGHVLPFTLLDGCLDEPLVLSRDDNGELHCFSNVCTHRGTLVVEGEGHTHTLRCRYHGRRFGLDGSFISMPEFDGVENFPTKRDDLPKLQLERYGPLLFTSVTPAFPFRELVAPLQERVGFLPLDEFTFDAASSRDYIINANWALYCDNYLEEFHIPYVHQSSLADLDYSAYRTETFEYCNLQFGYAKNAEGTFSLPAGHPDADKLVAAFYYWLFPNIMLNFYPWGLSLNLVQPLAAQRTKVSFLSYVWDAGMRSSGAGSDLHRVEMEDEEVVEAVQRGVRSRLYDRGRYSPRREVGTHHFHRLLARFMNEGAAP
jgi:choline monooxygenase